MTTVSSSSVMPLFAEDRWGDAVFIRGGLGGCVKITTESNPQHHAIAEDAKEPGFSHPMPEPQRLRDRRGTQRSASD